MWKNFFLITYKVNISIHGIGICNFEAELCKEVHLLLSNGHYQWSKIKKGRKRKTHYKLITFELKVTFFIKRQINVIY